MAAEMAEQPAILALIADRFRDERDRVAELIPRPFGGVAWVARGSSDNAALLGRYLTELASGRPSSLVAPSLHTRYRAAVDYRDQLVVALSQSGATPEIVTTASRLLAAGGRVVAITNDPSSPLAQVAHVTLLLNAGLEIAVPATKTVTAEMLLVLAVAAAFGEERVDVDGLEHLSESVATVLADRTSAGMLAERWVGRDRFLVLARGLLLASAMETALKVRETTGVFAQALSVADLLHGPIASIDQGLPVLLLDGGGPASADVDEVAARLTVMEVDVARCSIGPGAELPLPPGLSEPLQAVLATVRGQQLAECWARSLGLDPDAPAGLSKITWTR